MSWKAVSAIRTASPTSSPTRPMPARHRLQLRGLWRSGNDPQPGAAADRRQISCARRWKRTPARPMRACGWRSISSARRPTITNCYDVLADPALASVVRTALGLPDSFATADIDKQVQAVRGRSSTSRISPTPRSSSKFLTRFTSLWEINQSDLDRRRHRSACCSPADRRRHLHRPDDGHAEAEVLRAPCRTASTSPFPRRSRSSAGSTRSPTMSPMPRPSAFAPPA